MKKRGLLFKLYESGNWRSKLPEISLFFHEFDAKGEALFGCFAVFDHNALQKAGKEGSPFTTESQNAKPSTKRKCYL